MVNLYIVKIDTDPGCAEPEYLQIQNRLRPLALDPLHLQ